MSEHPPGGARPVSRRVLTDDVFEAVKAMVMDHAIEPRQRLSMDGLAQQLGVSHTPVREALARLEAVGLAVKEPLRGYRATALLSRTELDDLFDFRLLVEPWAAGRAAQCSDDGRRGLVELLEGFQEAPAEGYARYRALTEHDQRFHDVVMALAGNDHARQALARTNCHLHIFRLYYVQQIGTTALAEHRAVAAAVTNGDAAGAAEAMRAHLKASRDRLRPICSDD